MMMKLGIVFGDTGYLLMGNSKAKEHSLFVLFLDTLLSYLLDTFFSVFLASNADGVWVWPN
jgi:hypothetical protein